MNDLESTVLGIMIATVSNRRKMLVFNLHQMLKHISIPFTVYIYNDDGQPIKEKILQELSKVDHSHMEIFVYNEQKEINEGRVGCGGARHYLFEKIKSKHEIIASLDDDMQILEGWYEAFQEAIFEHPDHSVFTGIVKDGRNGELMAGSHMIMDGNILKRKTNKIVPLNYTKTEWGPLGALILCRKSLLSHVKIPNVFVREDSAFYLELKKLGINETIVTSKAQMIHRPFYVPDSGLRSSDKLKEAKEYFKKNHGIDRE